MALILYTVTVIDHVNNPNNTLANTDIVIRTTQSGTPLALIYEDEDGLIPIAQPGAKTNSLGVFEFYAASASYNFTATVNGETKKITGFNLDQFAVIFKNVNEMAQSTQHALGKRYLTGRTAWEVVSFNTNVPLSGGFFAKALTPVSPVDFEADKTGATESTFAFVSARNAASESKQSQVWDFGVYKLKDYNILDSDVITSEGAIIRPLNNTDVSVIANEKNDWKLLGATIFEGSRLDLEDKTNTGECGLRIIGGTNFQFENLTFKRFKGKGYDRVDAEFQYYGNKAQGDNIKFIECLQGAKLLAQYDTYTNMSAIANELGVESLGGNLNWVGGNVTDNEVGFKITDYENNAHGIISAVQFNHNKNLAIDIDKTREGFTFADCHIYADTAVLGKGGVRIKHSRGIDFNGGTADCWIGMGEFLGIEEDNYFRNMYAPGGYGPLKIFNSTTGLRSTSMRVSGVYGPGAINAADGLNVNDISPVAYIVKRPNVSPQLLAAGNSFLIFSAVDLMGDVRGNLTSQGSTIYEFPCVIDGWYNVNADFAIAGTTISDTFVEIFVDDVSAGFVYGNNLGSFGVKTVIKFDINKDFYATSKITMQVNTAGTELVHAHPPFSSRLKIELINK